MWGEPVVDSQGPTDVKDIPAKGQPGLGGSDPQQGDEGLPKERPQA